MCLGGILPQLPLNLSVCNNARDHHRALREISHSPQRHRTLPHGTRRLAKSAP